MSARHTRETRRIQARLERWELGHLRQLCADQAAQLEALADQIEQLQRDIDNSEASLDFWHGHALDLQQTLHETGAGQIGITRAGELLVLPPAAITMQEAAR